MTDLDPKLDPMLVWNEHGHLADPAVNALADGELTLLPPEAVAHVERCEQCGERVGRVALFALEIDEALGSMSAPRTYQPGPQIALQPWAAAPHRRRLPTGPLVAALLTACVGLLPTLHQLAPQLGNLHTFTTLALPHLIQLCARMLSRAVGGNLAATFVWAATAFLLLGSAAVARWARTAENPRTSS